ncbi:MAG: hypothetical protein HZB40_06720 [Rhodocyclales bacterium]|nr:hypothetical protein [Rhodocyclales bacterium]
MYFVGVVALAGLAHRFAGGQCCVDEGGALFDGQCCLFDGTSREGVAFGA